MFRVRFRARVAALLAISLLAAAFVAPPAALGAATFTVNTLADTIADDGVCSLREAITIANAGSAAANGCLSGGGAADITFSVAGTIQLTSALPQVTGTIVIDGGETITVDGMGAYQVFRVSGGSLTLRDLTVRRGNGTFGGAIANAGTLYAFGITVSSSTATNGGGIYHSGALLDIRNSTINGNTAPYGGGVYLAQPATITNSTFQGNKATTGGGAMYVEASTTLTHVTVVGNSAPSGGGGGQLATATVQIANSLFAGNAGGNSISLGGGGGASLSTFASSAAGIVDTVLRDNGGPTKTLMLLPTATDELGGADSATCADAPVLGLDQRGNARPADACDRGAVQRDRVPPKVSDAPRTFFRSGVSLSGTSSRAGVAWAGYDDRNGMGIDRFILQRQVNGGAWSTLATVPGAGEGSEINNAGVNVSLAKDSSYRFRVRAYDQDGNASAWSYSPTVKARLVQQTSTSVRFSSGWTTASSTKYSGGSVKYTSTAGRSVSITFTGREIALITTRRSTSSPVARLYVDGVDLGFITITAGTTAYRFQERLYTFPSSATHTVRLVVQGGARLDIDGFAVLR